MICALAAHISGRQTVDLIIDARRRLASGAGVVVTQLGEQFSDLRHVPPPRLQAIWFVILFPMWVFGKNLGFRSPP